MSLKYAVLGFISTEPVSGYDLSIEFGETLGWFWHAKHSQIYPALKKLEKEGLIKSKKVIKGKSLNKTVYSITSTGRKVLAEWVSTPPEVVPQKEAESVKLIFMDVLESEQVDQYLDDRLEQFEDQLTYWHDQLHQMKSRTHPRLEKRLANLDHADFEIVKLLKELAVEQQIMRREADIAWVKESKRRLKKLSARKSPRKR